MRLKVGRSRLPVEIFSQFDVKEISISVDGLEHGIVCRLSDSDPEVFDQVFIRNDYQHPMMPDEAKVVIDAGANVGYSVLYFRKKYPTATILALEPDPENYAMLRKNCDHLNNVILLNAALWKTNTTLALSFTGDDGRSLNAWGVRTHEAKTTSKDITPAYSILYLMEKYAIDEIDVCKIDIEGAEKAVFEDVDAAWYDKVNLFVIETHDRFAKGSDAAVKSALPLEKWMCAKKTENQFFKRIK